MAGFFSMSTLRELIADLRFVDLGQPDTNSPSPGQIYTKVRDWGQYLLNQANLSGINWSVGSKPFTFSAGQPKQALKLADFGKPISVWTANSADPDFLPQEVMLVELDALGQYAAPGLALPPFGARTPMPAQGGYGQQPEKGRWPGGVMAIYREAGQPTIHLMPPLSVAEAAQPQQFVLWYEAAAFNANAVESSPMQAQWHPYLRALVANDCLPLCRWSSLDGEQAAALYERLSAQLQAKLLMFGPQFQEYIQTDRNMGQAEAIDYAAWYEETAW